MIAHNWPDEKSMRCFLLLFFFVNIDLLVFLFFFFFFFFFFFSCSFVLILILSGVFVFERHKSRLNDSSSFILASGLPPSGKIPALIYGLDFGHLFKLAGIRFIPAGNRHQHK